MRILSRGLTRGIFYAKIKYSRSYSIGLRLYAVSI